LLLLLLLLVCQLRERPSIVAKIISIYSVLTFCLVGKIIAKMFSASKIVPKAPHSDIAGFVTSKYYHL